MPVNKNAMTRYKILDELLSNRYHNYSLDDLTDEVNNRLVEFSPDSNGVVRRTIEKDLYYLEYEGPFLVEIERYSVPMYDADSNRTKTKQCLRYANASYSIFHKSLTKEEEYILREVLSLMGQMDGLPNFESLCSLKSSLHIDPSMKKVMSFTKSSLEDSRLLAELFTAISQQIVVRINYHKFSTPTQQSSIVMYPYLLKEYNRRWYLIGAAESDNKILTFCLDRIDSCEFLSANKFLPYNGDIENRFSNVVGISVYEGKPIYTVVFWVSSESVGYVRTKALHHSQRELCGESLEMLSKKYPHLLGGGFFQIKCQENYELIRELSSFGANLLVLQPSHIRKAVIRMLEQQIQQYQSL